MISSINSTQNSYSYVNNYNQNNKNTSNINNISPQLAKASASPFISPASNTASFAIYDKMNSMITGLEQGVSNTASMANALNTAEGGLSSISDSLHQVRRLSLQAANGTLTDSDRNIIQNQIGGLLEGINNVSNYTQFNGNKLINGTFVNKNTASSYNGLGQNISIPNMSLGGLGISGYNITKNFDIGKIDSAISAVNSTRSNIGSSVNRLGHTINSNAIAEINLVSAKNNLAYTNIAKSSIIQNRNRIVEQYQNYMRDNSLSSAKSKIGQMI